MSRGPGTDAAAEPPPGAAMGTPLVGAGDGHPFDARLARRAPVVLREFNRAGVLSAADVHVARCLVRLTGKEDAAHDDAARGSETSQPDDAPQGRTSTVDAAQSDGAGPGGTTTVVANQADHAGPGRTTTADGNQAEDAGHAEVLLAAALAVRAPRLGHVCTDLATVAGTVALDSDVPLDVAALPWPEPRRWIERLSASSLVSLGEEGIGNRPLRLAGTRLYLDRYWREEGHVALELLARAEAPADGVDLPVLRHGLVRLFGVPAHMTSGNHPLRSPDDGEPAPAPDHQRLAAAAAVLRRFSVVAGGPGTGKTTTVARVLALLHEQAEATGAPAPLVALAAPTGKAAARLEEAVHEEAAKLDVSEAVRDRLLRMEASTLHRLLGWLPGNRSRFRHHRGNRLPHEVVVVDETSMVSLSLMARLVEAVRPAARLVLVGDPEQLASVEAGAVLGDIVGPAAGRLLMREPARRVLAEAAQCSVPAVDAPQGAGAGVGDGIVVLRHVHRFGGGIAALADAVREGDADAVMTLLHERRDDLTWVATDVAGPGSGGGRSSATAPAPSGTAPVGAATAATAAAGEGAGMATVRHAAVAAAGGVIYAARGGRAEEALVALGAFRVLCAHRHGPYGVTTWMERIERWLSAGVEGFAREGGEWYAGRPLLVTENDYGLRLYNGDTGVVVADPSASGRLSAVFERRGELLRFSPTRLAAVDTVYAMTVHKSQGSQFDTVAVLLPDPASPILTRELLYTAVTRARRRLILAGTEDAVRAAVGRPIARASGLRDRLWGNAVMPPVPTGTTEGEGQPPTVR